MESNEPFVLSYENMVYFSRVRRPIANTFNRYYLIPNGAGGYLRDRFFTREEDGSFKIFVGYRRDEEQIPEDLYIKMLRKGKATVGTRNIVEVDKTRSNIHFISRKRLYHAATVRPDNSIEFLRGQHEWHNFTCNSFNHVLRGGSFAHRRRRGGFVWHTRNYSVPVFNGLKLDLDTLLSTEECKSKYEVVVRELSRKKLNEMMPKYKTMLNFGASMFSSMTDESFYALIKDVLTDCGVDFAAHDRSYSYYKETTMNEIDALVDRGLNMEALAMYLYRSTYEVRRIIKNQHVYKSFDVPSLTRMAINRFKRDIKSHRFTDITNATAYELGERHPDSMLVGIQPKEKQHV